jgi:hypothetical protein
MKTAFYDKGRSLSLKAHEAHAIFFSAIEPKSRKLPQACLKAPQSCRFCNCLVLASGLFRNSSFVEHNTQKKQKQRNEAR